jgi:FkbM family methyltransferase
MKFFRLVAEVVFDLVYPIMKPPVVQQILRRFIALPYSMTKRLNYRGLVPFVVRDRNYLMQSYNTPIEMTVFWRGIFKGREGGELRVWSDISTWASVILDIGANTGIYALVSSAETGKTIHAFEPVHAVYEMLKENIELNPSVLSPIIPHQIAIGACDGEVTMYVPEEGWIDVASLNRDFAKDHSTSKIMKEEKCTGMSLDTFLAEQGVAREAKVLCKIDVEGAEGLVLAGGGATIARPQIVFLIEALDVAAFDAIKVFFPSSYKIYGVDLKTRRLFKTDVSSDRANNYLFVQKDSFDVAM